MHAEGREELIERLLGAKTKEDADAAEATADRYLGRHPDDHGVLAARRRLEERRGAPHDPRESERGPALRWIAALVAVAVAAALVAREFGAGWGLAAGVGLALGVEALYWAWEGVGVWREYRRRCF